MIYGVIVLILTALAVGSQLLLDTVEVALPTETFEDELTVPDFQVTEISDQVPEQPAQAASTAPELAEEIDFSVFTAALNESAPEPAPAVDPSSADFVLDLELPDLEPVSAETPAPAMVHAEPVDAPLEVPADALGDEFLLPEDLVLDAAEPETGVATEASIPSDGLEALDVAELEKLLEAESAEAAALQAPAPEDVADASPEALPVDLAEAEPAQDVANLLDALPQEEGGSDDAVKVIDTLRIGIPLYNVYLNEADEWSRRLVTCLQEWALELHEPLPDTAVALSHSLAGSSATVGFTALSEMARVLEHTLQHVQLQSGGTEEQAAAFMAAAEDIRRLLHQFAAGFLKEPSPEVLAQLRQILETEVVSTQSPPEEDAQAYLDAAEQEAHDARRQQPRFAAAGAGFDDDAASGIEGAENQRQGVRHNLS